MIKTELFFKDEVNESKITSLYGSIFDEAKSGEIGYYHLPDSNIAQIEQFCKSKKPEKIKNIVILGVGGSSLGVKAIDLMLSHTSNRNDKNLIFLENVDPVEITQKSKDLNLHDSLFIVTSKSGSTIETTSILKFLLDKFELSFDDKRFCDHFVFITDENSPLDKWAKDFDITTFYIPQNVGGRFSVLSAVGLLPLGLVGYDIKALLEGAKSLKESFFNQNEDELLKKAIVYTQNAKTIPINVLFSYSSSLKYFNDWLVQLWAESLGKIDYDGERVGLTPVGLVGAIDQHSFLQLIIQGVKNKSVTMIKVKNFQNDLKIPDIKLPNLDKVDFINNHTFNELLNAQCDASMQSIIEQGVRVDLIEIDSLSEQSAGYMIYYYELLTSLCGVLLNINTYDQPGVEQGKVILKEKFD